MAIVGMRKLSYFSRLRKLLRAANGWVCDLPVAVRRAQIKKQERAYETAAKAVATGDLPNAAISDDFQHAVSDDSLMPTAAKPARAAGTGRRPWPRSSSSAARGVDFLNYLKFCRGKAGSTGGCWPDAKRPVPPSWALCTTTRSSRTACGASVNITPTTRKLLDTAQGLGDTDAPALPLSAAILPGILHTLNEAYETLYKHPSAGCQHGRFHRD